MQLKTIAALVFTTGIIVGVAFALMGNDSGLTVDHSTDQSTKQNAALDSDAHRVAEGEQPTPMVKTAPQKPTDAPNFDTRSLVQNAKKAAPSELTTAQAQLVIDDKQAEMQGLIDEYNQALDDPKKREALERKFKLHSQEYKKALLAKVKNGDLWWILKLPIKKA